MPKSQDAVEQLRGREYAQHKWHFLDLRVHYRYTLHRLRAEESVNRLLAEEGYRCQNQ
jgi:hypothetical protein